MPSLNVYILFLTVSPLNFRIMTTNDTSLSRRIAQIRRELCNDDNTEFARRLGKSRQYTSALCNGRSQAGKQTLDLILSALPMVNRQWLYFGDGSMLTSAPAPASTSAQLYADIADTYAHLAHLFSRLAVCVSPSAS